MAIGGVDASVRLYISASDGMFHLVCRLTGHTDWVRSLAFSAHQGGVIRAFCALSLYLCLEYCICGNMTVLNCVQGTTFCLQVPPRTDTFVYGG